MPCTLRPDPTVAVPPIPLVPLPTPMRIRPAQPAVVAPVPKLTHPEFPVTDVPVLKCRSPDTPKVPALAHVTEIVPLLVTVPSPLLILTTPPVALAAHPADANIVAEAPLVPLPTSTRNSPLRPELDKPVAIVTDPLLPDILAPELNTKRPLPPLAPAFTDKI